MFTVSDISQGKRPGNDLYLQRCSSLLYGVVPAVHNSYRSPLTAGRNRFTSYQGRPHGSVTAAACEFSAFRRSPFRRLRVAYEQ